MSNIKTAGLTDQTAPGRLPELTGEIVMVTGSRSIERAEIVNWCLDYFLERRSMDCLIHGAARGVDRLADQWAKIKNIQRYPLKPEYHLFPPATRRFEAPKARNSEMVILARAVIAIWDGESTGTQDAYQKALKKNIPICLFNLKTKKISWNHSRINS